MTPRFLYNAQIAFVSNTNERIIITIPRARQDISEAEARDAMQTIIDGNAVTTRFGRPASIHSAELVTTERTAVVPRPLPQP